MLNKTVGRRVSALFLLPVVFILCSSLLIFFITWWGSYNIIFALGISFAVFVSEALFFYLFSRSAVVLQTKPAVIWLTGLSAAGKTTIANDLVRKFKQRSVEPVLLDGDEIRNAIKLTGFDETSRKKHNLSVGYIAALFEKQRHLVIVALISPYRDTRDEVRKMCHTFIEVYVSTGLDECIRRDPKGLYEKALNGQLPNFTGISAPYEAPEHPEIIIDTTNTDVNRCSEKILQFYGADT